MVFLEKRVSDKEVLKLRGVHVTGFYGSSSVALYLIPIILYQYLYKEGIMRATTGFIYT